MGISTPQNPESSTRLRLGDAARSNAGLRQHKSPSMKVAGLMIVALCRMKKVAGEWEEKKLIKEALVRKVEGMATSKGKKRGSNGRGR